MLGPFCGVVYGVLSSLAIIILKKRQLVALLSCNGAVFGLWLFLVVKLDGCCLQWWKPWLYSFILKYVFFCDFFLGFCSSKVRRYFEVLTILLFLRFIDIGLICLS